MKIFCVGRNYVAHAKELDNEVPEHPLIFMKPKTALLKPVDDFYYPGFTNDLHYECELVIRMGKNGKSIQPQFASRYYDRISIGLDFTARDIQKKLKSAGHPWEIAKAFDQSAIIGSWMEVNEVQKKQAKTFQLYKNGEKVQNGNTDLMIFSVEEIIAYISRFFTLNTGDLIYTGTPAGVGPVQINDHLVGYLEGVKRFEVVVK